ncbi:hypothetical protein NHP190012_16720 (plasmid) [Helicobacter sp. NHP19-012]|uniref:Uncharacterized protein n=1 Tax=Helicobacter gastrofelis TaxID=2849642 RepID=A0ABN6I8Z6_9HELI|nr:hypothetical protein NHP190012_16720 [Helicobacter sp. NHP19-012]GMB92204.1 hypothetical protein NHP190009_13870 [Helicobacter ailurogastricus]GMB96877.1 hypothetical protein NHP22001_14660 [Helicobacter sp. NHP22-001]
MNKDIMNPVQLRKLAKLDREKHCLLSTCVLCITLSIESYKNTDIAFEQKRERARIGIYDQNP